jgi:hypothetical protein
MAFAGKTAARLKLLETSFIPNYNFYLTDRFLGRKDIPHNHVDP